MHALVLAGAGLAACAAPPAPPYLGPPAELSSESSAGTLLTREGTTPVLPQQAPLEVRVTFLALQRHLADSLPQLSQKTGLIVPARGDDPLGAAPRHLGGTHVGYGEDADQTFAELAVTRYGPYAWLGDRRQVLEPGNTAEFSAALGQETLFLLVERPGSGPLQLALRYSPAPAGTRTQGEEVAQRDETLLFSTSEGDDRLLLVVPSPFEAAPRDALALSVIWSEAGHEEEEAEAPEAPAPAPLLTVLRENFATPLRERRTLLFAAGETTAQAADSVALASPEDVVVQWGKVLLEALATAPPQASAEEIRWILDRTALQTLARRAQERELEPELEAILLRHCGEVGRTASLLLEILPLPEPEYRRRLMEENTEFLQDFSPASRLRASEWLVAQGVSLEGYDPLADQGARRAALNALEKKEEEPRDESP